DGAGAPNRRGVRAPVPVGDVRGRRPRHPRRALNRRRPGARTALGAMLVMAALSTSAARAGDGALVVLVHPPAASPGVREALVRLRGELAAEGFESRIEELDLGSDARAALERAAPGLPAVAVVAVLPVTAAAGGQEGAEPNAVEVWVVDRVTRKTV